MTAWLQRLWYPSSEEGTARRVLLSPLEVVSWVYRGAVAVRNRLYQRNLLPVARVSGARVISVGNLNVGGAGKTPAVIHLAQLYAKRGKRVAVLSRGYGRRARADLVLHGHALPSAREAGDEPLLIARRCPEATVLVGTNRRSLADRARDEFGADVILLDDGMQYRSLHRDLEVIVVDEAAGFGNGRLLPRGPLREPPAALTRADLLWLRADGRKSSLGGTGPPHVRVRYRPSSVLSPEGRMLDAGALRGRKVFAFAGLARSDGFLRTVEEMSATRVGSRFYGDHHLFRPEELSRMESAAEAAGAELLVTTEKDLMRLPAGFPAWAIRLDLEVTEGEALLLQKLGLG